jgi:hypothetical protein
VTCKGSRRGEWARSLRPGSKIDQTDPMGAIFFF